MDKVMNNFLKAGKIFAVIGIILGFSMHVGATEMSVSLPAVHVYDAGYSFEQGLAVEEYVLAHLGEIITAAKNGVMEDPEYGIMNYGFDEIEIFNRAKIEDFNNMNLLDNSLNCEVAGKVCYRMPETEIKFITYIPFMRENEMKTGGNVINLRVEPKKDWVYKIMKYCPGPNVSGGVRIKSGDLFIWRDWSGGCFSNIIEEETPLKAIRFLVDTRGALYFAGLEEVFNVKESTPAENQNLLENISLPFDVITVMAISAIGLLAIVGGLFYFKKRVID